MGAVKEVPFRDLIKKRLGVFSPSLLLYVDICVT